VHPSNSEVHGIPAYKSVQELPGVPDAAFIGVNRHLTIEVVKALRDIGCGGGVCFAAGFLEADETGGELQAELIEAAADMPVLGPNCYGYINYADGALLWPDQQGGKRLDEGKSGVAIIAQSSNIAINFTMQKRGLPLSYIFTVGNQALVGISELALNLLEDPRVTTLGIYIEAFDSVSAFEELARKSRALNKPVVVYYRVTGRFACSEQRVPGTQWFRPGRLDPGIPRNTEIIAPAWPTRRLPGIVNELFGRRSQHHRGLRRKT
jgi:acyl-CoA synthetase (NDP forming)